MILLSLTNFKEDPVHLQNPTPVRFSINIKIQLFIILNEE